MAEGRHEIVRDPGGHAYYEVVAWPGATTDQAGFSIYVSAEDGRRSGEEVATGTVNRGGCVNWILDPVGGMGSAIHRCSLADFEMLLAASRRAVALAGEVAGV